LESLLTSGPYPSRRPKDNLADLDAQIAACQAGVSLLKNLARHYTRQTMQDAMEEILHTADTALRRAVALLPQGAFSYTDSMDSGDAIKVHIQVDAAASHCLQFDF